MMARLGRGIENYPAPFRKSTGQMHEAIDGDAEDRQPPQAPLYRLRKSVREIPPAWPKPLRRGERLCVGAFG
jgi:hypothetical protein